jgi:hypothetical protein
VEDVDVFKIYNMKIEIENKKKIKGKLKLDYKFDYVPDFSSIKELKGNKLILDTTFQQTINELIYG